MDSPMVQRSSETEAEQPKPVASDFFLEQLETETGRIAGETTHGFEEEMLRVSTTTIDENVVNRNRLRLLRTQFTSNLMTLILEDDFEYGIETKADKLVRDQISLNALVTKEWLNSLFVENFENVPIALGILRLIARMEYSEVYPQGQTMALAALSHSNEQIQECGVRAYESWVSLDSLQILENLSVSTQWLQEYIDEVVSDLRKQYSVSTR